MAREPKINVTLPTGVASYVHVYSPDDEAPEGADWKPDGKYKLTLVYNDEAEIAAVRKTMVDALKAKFPGIDEDEFVLPFKSHGEDAKKEALRGKTVIKSATQFPPTVWDSAGNQLTEEGLVKSGDRCRVKGSLYLYKKTEKVKEGKKLIEVDTYGVSVQLNKVQLIEKRAGGDDDGFDAVEGGYVGGEQAPKAAAKPTAKKASKTDETDTDDNGAGDGDF